MPENQSDKDEDQQIVEHLPYTNELMQAIRQINEVILKEPELAVNAARNFITDIPRDWREEVKEEMHRARIKRDQTIKAQSALLSTGTSESQKLLASQNILNAKIEYAYDIKEILIWLVNKKMPLFVTKRKIERGALSLYELGEVDNQDD